MAQERDRFIAYVRLDVELQVPLKAREMTEAVREAHELTTSAILGRWDDLVDEHSKFTTGVFSV